MNFDLTDLPRDAVENDVTVGDVLQAKGGHRDTALWVVAAVRGQSVHLLGLSSGGEIVSTASYGLHAIRGRVVVGRCADFETMRLHVNAKPFL